LSNPGHIREGKKRKKRYKKKEGGGNGRMMMREGFGWKREIERWEER